MSDTYALPRFKATKSMSALIQERQRRQKDKARSSTGDGVVDKPAKTSRPTADGGLSALVESVKRKSHGTEVQGGKKRRKI